MIQSPQVSELFFIRVESRNKYACVIVTLRSDHLSVCSSLNEDYRINYRDIFSCVKILVKEGISTLQLNFISVKKSGLIFKQSQRTLQALNLLSIHPIKIEYWNEKLQNIISTSSISNEETAEIQFDLGEQILPKDHTLLTIEQEPASFLIIGKVRQQAEEEKNQQVMRPRNIEIGKLLVFVNPASGKGLAQQKWNQALVILSKTGHSFRVINTEYSGHCRDIISKMDLEELQTFQGIILDSGDGLPHEAINGLFTRPDWQQAKQVPIGVLPGGSGNAFAKNVTFESGLDSSNENNAFLIAKGCTRNIDLMLFETQEGQRIFSFLSLAWSFIADVDLGSEGMRFLGETRFTVYGTWRAIFQRRYPGVLYYTKEKLSQQSIDDLVNDSPNRHIPRLSQDMDAYKQNIDQGIEGQGYQWVGGAERDFTYFLITKQPYISENYYAAPFCKLDDGLMDIQFLYSDDGWTQLVSLALNQETGKHVDMKTQTVIKGSRCKYEKVSAFRLCPSNATGQYSVDGEKYKAQTIQGIVLNNMLKVYCM